MTTFESALSELSSRLIDIDSTLTASLSDILAAALRELIEAELTATGIGAHPAPCPLGFRRIVGGQTATRTLHDHRLGIRRQASGIDTSARGNPLRNVREPDELSSRAAGTDEHPSEGGPSSERRVGCSSDANRLHRYFIDAGFDRGAPGRTGTWCIVALP